MADRQVDGRDSTGDRRCQDRLCQRPLRRAQPVLCGRDRLVVRVQLGVRRPGGLVRGQAGLTGGHTGLGLRDRCRQGGRVDGG